MTLHIRRGRRTDYEQLASLGAWPQVDGSPRRSIRLFRKTVSDLGCDLYVADEDGTLVGMIAVSYVRVPSLGGQRASLEEIAVREDRRRAGIGRQLVEFVTRRAAKRGARALGATARDEACAGFLSRVGFSAGGRSYERPLV